MKCFVPEISWHNRDPVYSLDIQPTKEGDDQFYRLASGGADSHVVIWHVTLQADNDSDQFASFECAADLQRHQKSVNVVRFSPNGLYLASGDDDGIIIIWKMRLDQDPPELGDEQDKESWITLKVLRGHLQDIYDLAWSPDSIHLVSGSIDNTAMLWNAEKGKAHVILGDHKGFVQGVAWDPRGKYIATLSTDRILRVFDAKKKKLVGRCYKSKLPWSTPKEKEGEKKKEAKDEKEKLNKMFHNDTLKTFFRRLNFSPGGELLIAPCGVLEIDGVNTDATYLFTRGAFNAPAVHLPSPGQYTVAVRCCPIFFHLRGSKPRLFALPYRIVYAVATRSTVVLYDTEQSLPFGFVANIHYTGLTDLTWSPDGRLLVVSSSEGFCSVIMFDENEIGVPFKKEDLKSTVESKSLLNESLSNENKGGDSTGHTKNEEKALECEINKAVLPEKSKGKSNIKCTATLEAMEIDLTDSPEKADPPTAPSGMCNDAKMTPEKAEERKMEIDQKITPEKIDSLRSDAITPKKIDEFKTPECGLMLTPMKVADLDYNDSQCSELSLVIEGDESELISKEEQARRLMSPYRGSPQQVSPSLRRTPSTEDSSPKTPKSGRRVSLITLASPKTKRKL